MKAKPFAKRLISVTCLLLALLMTLAGCNGGSSTLSVPSSIKNPAGDTLPVKLELMTPYFFASDSSGGESALNMRREWTDAMTARYKVDISVTVPTPESYLSMMQEFIDGTSTGIANVSNFSEVLYFMHQDLIEPLDEYLKDNLAWKSLPEDMRKLYEIDGHVWAVPSSFYYEFSTRSFRTDWLEEIDMEMPTTLEGFMEYAKLIADNKNIDGKAVASIQTLALLLDVFNAFGMQLDSSGTLPYAYDPELDCIADAFLKPGAEAALEYLREMYEAGGMAVLFYYEDYISYSEDMQLGEYGSTYEIAADVKYGHGMYAYAEKMYEETGFWPDADQYWTSLTTFYEEITGLLNADGKTTQVIYPTSTAYVMRKGTEQPSETINFFVDLLFASEDNYLEAALGLDSYYIKNYDGTITMIQQIDYDASSTAGTTMYLPTNKAGLVGRIEDYYDAATAKVHIGTNTDGITREDEINNYKSSMLQTAEQQGIIVKADPRYAYVNSNLLANSKEIPSIFKDCFMQAITGTEPISAVLAKYRSDMQAAGGNTVLSQANDALGLTPKQSY